MADRIIRQRGARRRTHWATNQASAIAVASTTAVLLETLSALHEGETVVRTRGVLDVFLQTAAAVGDGFSGALGFGVVTAAAAAAGVASIPTPMTEAAWDGWFLHQFFNVHRGLDGNADGSAQKSFLLDSKAMRKVTEDDRVVVVAEFVETGIATMSLFESTRILSMT